MRQIDRRIEAFRTLGARFQHEAIAPLILVHKIDPSLFGALVCAARIYMDAAALNSWTPPGDILPLYDSGQVYAVTPAGMIVPKRTSWLAFNAVVRVFSDIMQAMGFGDLIDSWHVPLNVRFKSSLLADTSAGRPHATEQPHSDSWAGESTESVTVHIPLMGDTGRNYLRMFYPDEDLFEEAWLGSRDDYRDGHDVLPHYRALDYVIPLGSVALIDFATLHATTRNPGSGARVSIDTTFTLKKRDMSERIHPWREGERASDEVLRSIGTTRVFYFPDAPDAQVRVDGFRHPTRMRIVEVGP